LGSVTVRNHFFVRTLSTILPARPFVSHFSPRPEEFFSSDTRAAAFTTVDMQHSDHELMLRCGQGDAAAFDLLVRRWELPVGNVLRRLVRNTADADDLRQDTFVRVLLASRRYRPTGEFSAWLFRIVVNLARDAARRRKRRHELIDQELIVEGNASPATESARRETAALVEDALGALPHRLREVLVLRHYGDLSFARMSEVLGEPASTVK